VGGFTYVGLLIAVAVLGVGLSAISEVWVTVVQRNKAEQARWAAQQFVRAIGSYYESSPGPKKFPPTTEHLLQDPRLPVTRRHLRQLYVNPTTGQTDWEWIRDAQGGLRGVRVRLPVPHEVRNEEFIYRPT
jgi:type II secretory pathway pseudopilin PulG